jgi:hypothetical protein
MSSALVAARAKAKAMHDAEQPLEIWEIDLLLQRCEALVAEWSVKQHERYEGVPAESIKMDLLRGNRNDIVAAARAILKESEP